jgi:hypothetical protein
MGELPSNYENLQEFAENVTGMRQLANSRTFLQSDVNSTRM